MWNNSADQGETWYVGVGKDNIGTAESGMGREKIEQIRRDSVGDRKDRTGTAETGMGRERTVQDRERQDSGRKNRKGDGRGENGTGKNCAE
jgi:hypothetical protein